MCDLDPDKVCDNCGKCIETGEEYAKIMIDAVLLDNDKDWFFRGARQANPWARLCRGRKANLHIDTKEGRIV
jgi:hypothetical protein